MGQLKKERNRVANAKANSGTGPTSHSLSNITHVKGVNFYRDAKKVRVINMRKGGKPTRNADGKIIKAAEYQSRLAPGTQARVEPNRKWFTNTRTIGQSELAAFREAMSTRASDPYTVILDQKKLPMSILTDSAKVSRMHLVETEPFSNTFGPKAQRKRPRIIAGTFDDLAANAANLAEKYDVGKDQRLLANAVTSGVTDAVQDPIFGAGQSKRIWNELYKVLDSSDVVIHVLDARDPNGTRCRSVEKYLKTEAKHKHLIFVLNKCDLVPTWVTSKWVKTLSKDAPTLAFHASITNSFGKGSLIQLLRQFSNLHKDKKQISVGFIGYPNVGKSSIINTLRSKKVCTVAPIPGETKVWQYITLMKRIYLIDCPGVVAPAPDDQPVDIVLKGVVRVENVTEAENYIPAVLTRVRKEYMCRTYDIKDWTDHEDFLGQIAKKSGKLLKGGEPDVNQVAKMILNDWIRGKIPFYTAPPEADLEPTPESSAEQKPTPSVQQIFSKIPVTAKFLPDDMVKEGETVDDDVAEEAAPEEDETANVEPSPESTKKSVKKDEDEDDAEGVTDWDEVFSSVVSEEVVPVIPGRELPRALPEEVEESVEQEEESVEQEEGGEESEASDAEVDGAVAQIDEADESIKAEDDEVAEEDSDVESESEPEPEVATPVRKRLAKATGKGKGGLPTFVVQDKVDKGSKKAAAKPTPSSASPKRRRGDDSDDEEAAQSSKAPRMTTNKKKVGTHYYETANVKNKNRNKSKPVNPETLTKKLQSTARVNKRGARK
ncbi:GTPase required for pre-60S ribosomal subunit nuclear export and maturation [Borealophlyctis nickersoniae]|nr:GTPase required for pre-60S ribosomal subunit nuclear export and maturation [Borealophlyctis nickersoniae]